jgi:hypothetical protein
LSSNTQGGSRVPESGSLGSVRGALSNERPYRDRHPYSVPPGLLRETRFGFDHVQSEKSFAVASGAGSTGRIAPKLETTTSLATAF